MTSRITVTRAGMLVTAILALVLAFTVGTTPLKAQTPCCDHVSVGIGDSVQCDITFCIITTAGRICATYTPGSVTSVPINCHVMAGGIILRDACGDTLRLRADTCVDNVLIGHGCCVKICLGRDANGCLGIRVARAFDCVPCSTGGSLGMLPGEIKEHVALKQD